MDTDTLFKRLFELMKQAAYYGHVLSLFDIDRETMLPDKAVSGRGEIKAFMAEQAAKAFTDPEIAEILDRLTGFALNPNQAALVKRIEEGYKRATMIPLPLVNAWAQATSKAHLAWTKAKAKSDFAVFLPNLREVLGLAKEKASALGYEDHPYDGLAADFEPGITAEATQRILLPLRQPLTELVKRIAEAKPVDESCMHGFFPPDRQERFSRFIAAKMGFDPLAGRLIVVGGHPMTVTAGPHDIRFTTKINPGNIRIGLFGTMHETGHTLYCQGANEIFDWLWFDLGGLACSMGIHESQSRLWENLIGRSLAFWEYFFPYLQAIMPEFQEVTLDDFWRAINIVRPSLIRVEADEATYCLHILLRLELELALLSGELDPKDLPEAWNAKMQEYFGIKPENDATGCLQDVHWSVGYIGYFASYALGNIMASMLQQRIHQDMAFGAELGMGNLSEIRAWLREHVHRWGMAHEMLPLVKTLTGEELNADAYLAYLETKYSLVYKL